MYRTQRTIFWQLHAQKTFFQASATTLRVNTHISVLVCKANMGAVSEFYFISYGFCMMLSDSFVPASCRFYAVHFIFLLFIAFLLCVICLHFTATRRRIFSVFNRVYERKTETASHFERTQILADLTHSMFSILCYSPHTHTHTYSL